MYNPKNLREEQKKNRRLRNIILMVCVYAAIATSLAISGENRGNIMQDYCNDMDERNYNLHVENEKLQKEVLKLEADIVELQTY